MKALGYAVCVVLAMVVLSGCNRSDASSADDGDGGGTPPAAAPADSAASPAAAVATAGQGTAFAPMTQKAGLWQLTETVGTHPASVTKMCVDAAMGANMAGSAIGGKMPGVDCSQTSIAPGAHGTDIAMTCSGQGRTIDSRIHVEATSENDFHQTMSATFTPGVAGHDSIESTTDGKWLGACPAGMKAGDIISATGIKINLYDAMNKMKGVTAPKAPN